MAMHGRWLSCYLSVFLLISCGNGVQLYFSPVEMEPRSADEFYYRYESGSSSSIHNTDLVPMKYDNAKGALRVKRYLAGEFDDLTLGKTSMAVTTDQDSFQDSGGKSSSGSGNTTSASDILNKTSESEATRIASMPVDPNEPKTGGNYMSVHNTSVTETTGRNISIVNDTTLPNANINVTIANITSVTSGTINNSNMTSSKENGSVNIQTSTITPIVPGKTNTTPTGDHITIANFPDDNLVNNKTTLAEHNITNSKYDSHVYYNSSFVSNDEKLGKFYWVDMDSHPNLQVNDMLSQSHRRAATVKLTFDFPFYGHTVRNVTIATGGFLYTGDYVHSWLAATQYIAPLMANFDTSLSNESYVKYMDNGTQFTVQWDKVKLQDKPESGVFTFQATLKKTGDIIFVYQSVPVVISNITDDNHPVKVGLSDAYIIDRHVLFVRRKTIYEYHRITFEHLSISNWTVISLIALPTCLEGIDCESCLTRRVGFDCFWCPETSKCSNGIDRNRQDWIMNDCDRQSLNNISFCPAVTNSAEVQKSSTTLSSTSQLEVQTEQTVTALLADDSSSVNVSALIGVLFCVGILLSLSFWALYAYRNPHTTSGQFLIKYRPSQWSWRRGEARYTAATIHM